MCVAGTDDQIDALDVREPRDRLRPTQRPDLLDPERFRRRGDESGARRRRHDDDPLCARDLGRYRAHDERRDEAAWHVHADRPHRDPAPLEHDARLDLELDVARTLRLVPAADAVGERQQRLARQQLGLGDRAGRRHAVQFQCPLAHGVEAAHLDVLDDVHETIRSTGTSRIDDAPAASSFGSSRQTSAAGTSACTATIPGSASGSTLGAREPGTSA